ncbi:MAG: diaminopimelate epimerase [Bacteroidetes bacterium HGW-Bacteroidetes-1]|jgi:diaminopimelate epimerase|nr:MAG: diaminopimelate epimerase [Bacteroidetes bacterium HGW-Bacteroidetes-1]
MQKKYRLKFHKYHGAGNDFIMVNGLTSNCQLTIAQITFLCNRHLGIGADGLIIIEKSKNADFKMIYFNADGLEGSMCGNGGRSAVSFALREGIVSETSVFEAFDGIHKAIVTENDKAKFQVILTMKNIDTYDFDNKRLIVNTGSPHYVTLTDNLTSIDIYKEGQKIRYDPLFSPHGINVNFMQMIGNDIHLRTYERGVENETLSCGTGVTAAAIAAQLWFGISQPAIYTKGGTLKVKLKKEGNRFVDIFLEGPVQCVFSGEIDI